MLEDEVALAPPSNFSWHQPDLANSPSIGVFNTCFNDHISQLPVQQPLQLQLPVVENEAESMALVPCANVSWNQPDLANSLLTGVFNARFNDYISQLPVQQPLQLPVVENEAESMALVPCANFSWNQPDLVNSPSIGVFNARFNDYISQLPVQQPLQLPVVENEAESMALVPCADFSWNQPYLANAPSLGVCFLARFNDHIHQLPVQQLLQLPMLEDEVALAPPTNFSWQQPDLANAPSLGVRVLARFNNHVSQLHVQQPSRRPQMVSKEFLETLNALYARR
ncbi:hypothetical protein HDU88_000622, partial [Geranomyces variabilis]